MIEPVGVEMRPEEEKNIFPMNFPPNTSYLALYTTIVCYVNLAFVLYVSLIEYLTRLASLMKCEDEHMYEECPIMTMTCKKI